MSAPNDADEAARRLEALTHHTALPHTRLSSRIDGFLRRIGEAASWLWIALLGVIVVNVLMRYVLGEGRIELEELQWHLYAVGLLIGIATAFEADAHVRVDVLHERLSLRMQAWIELYGLLLLFFPFVALVLYYAVPFVGWSWESSEVSSAPGGLPYRWAIKAALPLGFGLLATAAISRLLRVSALLFGAPAPLREESTTAGDG